MRYGNIKHYDHEAIINLNVLNPLKTKFILRDFCNIKFVFLLSPPNKTSFSFSFSGTRELIKAGLSLVEFRAAIKKRARVIFSQWPWANCSNHTVISIDELPTQDTCPVRRIFASCYNRNIIVTTSEEMIHIQFIRKDYQWTLNPKLFNNTCPPARVR